MTMLYRSTDCLSRCGAPMEYLAHSASFQLTVNNAPSKPGIKHLDKILGLLGAATIVLMSPSAYAQETITYTYDELGRLTEVEKTNGPSNGEEATYAYDPAGNRTNVTVTGSPNGDGSGGGPGNGNPYYVIVPLNGFTLIVGN